MNAGAICIATYILCRQNAVNSDMSPLTESEALNPPMCSPLLLTRLRVSCGLCPKSRLLGVLGVESMRGLRETSTESPWGHNKEDATLGYVKFGFGMGFSPSCQDLSGLGGDECIRPVNIWHHFNQVHDELLHKRRRHEHYRAPNRRREGRIEPNPNVQAMAARRPELGVYVF